MEITLIVGCNVNVKSEEFEIKMQEMVSLCDSAELHCAEVLTQNLPQMIIQTCIGSGKVQEVAASCRAHDATLVVFYNALTPLQIRNLAKELNCEVIDRTMLILRIFQVRAQTREAKLQVEIARLKYELPRLNRQQANLDQQRGGSAITRGAGEQKRELSRRTIERRIATLEAQCRQLSVQRQVQYRRRQRSQLREVCLVGYSNAGKSSLMNALLQQAHQNADKQVLVRDELFATLDTQVRRLPLGNGQTFLLSDTVGFVSDLPDMLLQSFESTLSQVQQADLLIHVIDASQPHWQAQQEAVEATLKRLHADNIERLVVYNKIDLAEDWTQADGLNISCTTNAGLETLRRQLQDKLTAPRV